MNGAGGKRLVVGSLVFAAGAALFGVAVADAVKLEALPPVGGIPPGEAGEGLGGDRAWRGGGPGDPGERTTPAPAREPSAASTLPASGPRVALGGGGVVPPPPARQVTQDEILEAVNQDLFLPTRTAPPQPYLLPSERRPAAARREPQRPRAPQIRVVGTALAGDFGLALVQVGDTLPTAVLLGESVEGYRLASVEPDRAVFQREEETLALPVVAAQLRTTAPNRQGASGRPQAPTAREMEELRGQVQEMLRNLMPGGGRGGGMMGPGEGAVIRVPGGGVVELRGPGGQLPGAILDALRQQGQLPPGTSVQVIRRPGGGGAP